MKPVQSMCPMCLNKKNLAAFILALGTGGALAPNALAGPLAGCEAPTKSNFSMNLTVWDTEGNARCGGRKSDTAEQLFDSLKTNGLKNIHLQQTGYTGSEAALLHIRFNSLPILLEFPEMGDMDEGATLKFTIPKLGVHRTFQGHDRDDSIDQMKDYIKKSSIIGDIMKYQIAHTPNNPITGPGGLLPTAAATDFELTSDLFLGDTVTKLAGNQLGTTLEINSTRLDGRSSKSATLPLSYTIRNDIDPRRQLIFSLPITMTEIDGAKSYTGSFGVAYRFPISRAWTITPAIRYGLVGSADMAAAASLYGGSVSSNYVLRFGGFDLAIGNMVGYYQTGKLKAGDYSVNPGLKNTVLRNGVLFSQPVSIGGRALSAEYSLIDTRYLGSDIYTDNTQEIGVSIGAGRGAASARSNLRAGLKYLHGRDVKSVALTVGYWF